MAIKERKKERKTKGRQTKEEKGEKNIPRQTNKLSEAMERKQAQLRQAFRCRFRVMYKQKEYFLLSLLFLVVENEKEVR